MTLENTYTKGLDIIFFWALPMWALGMVGTFLSLLLADQINYSIPTATWIIVACVTSYPVARVCFKLLKKRRKV